MIRKILILLFLFSGGYINSQEKFNFTGVNKNVQSVKFQLINNLIVVPLKINGSQLSFILDTGVNKTILFNLSKEDSLGLNNVKKISLQGLGTGKPVEALLSQKNSIRIHNYVGVNNDVYVILNDTFDVSGKMGTTIHGIIGYELLKGAVVKINYRTRKIYFYNPETFSYKKCRKCETFPLSFYRNKPYIDAKVQLDTVNNKLSDVKLLIDTGGSDAIWLFENTKKEIQTPKKYFRDILGEGLSGSIYGNRSRIPSMKIGSFKIVKPTISFLDSTSTLNARKFKKRNGSIGGGILKRFKVWIDYPNKKITLKKNGSFKGGFEYNMSGLSIVYNAKVLVKTEGARGLLDVYDITGDKTSNFGALPSSVINYSYRFKHSYKIDKVLEDSPGGKAGLQKGDIIMKINGSGVFGYTLKELMSVFQERHDKKIKLVVERNGQPIKFEFRLEKRI